ncbi:MAG TPA: ATPase, T2SS/T4P/T4SS family [Candidatus Dormibacteraeota bacterium]|nr:ATPase, T2SS/T4P/T4SS family [Candidatus Dormibacteraeota bacterium]
MPPAALDLAPQLGYRTLPVKPWPDVDAELYEVCRTLADHLERYRRLHDVAPSVSEEEGLFDTINDLVDQALERPVEFGINKAVANDIADDPGFRERVVRGTMVLASHLFPLSRLLYLEEGVEEIHVYRWDTWVIQGPDFKVQLSPEGNPLRSDEAWLDFFKEKVITLPGTTGQKMLSQGRPTAEVNVGGLIRLALLQPPAISGPTSLLATIRVQGAARVRSLEDYVSQGTMPRGVAEFLLACVLGKANIIISGGTGSGKTTLLRVLAGSIPWDEQLAVLEDSAELHLENDRGDGLPWHPYVQSVNTVEAVLRGEPGITMRDLVKLALRLRPDRIILGEARDASMADVCLAASTGHDGSMVTLHADDAEEAIRRAAEYVMMSPDFMGSANAESMALRRVHQAFDVTVHLRQRGGRRQVTGIVAMGDGVGDRRWVYSLSPEGRLVREISLLGDLPSRLAYKLAPYLAGVPPV